MLGMSLSICVLATRQSRRECCFVAQIPGLKALYDPSDRANMFTDIAMTTQVTADGQAVAVIRDQSGNNHHLTQPIAAARPLYRTNGTLHWLEGDGVDDILTCASPVSAYPFTIAAGFEPLSAAEGGIATLYQNDSNYKSLMVNGYLRAIDRASSTQQAARSNTVVPVKSYAMAQYSSNSVKLETSAYSITSDRYTQTFGTPSDF
ncbi:hypothetical protein [Albirhodobacter sp. R86504]|uniref:hypothetical protein n=1 Tax=Albirhodobacter sp. R86504 TaxID=3093848 RepID=UPI0036716CF3